MPAEELTMPSVPRWFPVLTCGTLAILAGIVAFTATAGLTTSIAAAAGAGVVCGIVAGKVLWRPSVEASRAAVPPGIRRLFAAGAPLLIGELLFVAAFIINPNLTRWDA